jgi:hypothetical protein
MGAVTVPRHTGGHGGRAGVSVRHPRSGTDGLIIEIRAGNEIPVSGFVEVCLAVLHGPGD